jgi:hypothetical protein
MCDIQWYSQSPGIQESDALLICLAASALVNQPDLTTSAQFMYTDLPLAAGPVAVKVATDWWFSRPLWPVVAAVVAAAAGGQGGELRRVRQGVCAVTHAGGMGSDNLSEGGKEQSWLAGVTWGAAVKHTHSPMTFMETCLGSTLSILATVLMRVDFLPSTLEPRLSNWICRLLLQEVGRSRQEAAGSRGGESDQYDTAGPFGPGGADSRPNEQ